MSGAAPYAPRAPTRRGTWHHWLDPVDVLLRALRRHAVNTVRGLRGHPIAIAFFSLPSLEMALRMLMAFTYLPGFVTLVFRGMPTVWRGRHRLVFCWLIFVQAVHPGRHTLEEMARWTPSAITAWRFGRLLKAA